MKKEKSFAIPRGTARDLAAASGISAAYISQLLRGQMKAGASAALRLVRASARLGLRPELQDVLWWLALGRPAEPARKRRRA